MPIRKSGQSSIEYVITMVWALLLVGIVVAVLFQLRVPVSSNLASPGECQIVRPYGAYSDRLVYDEGICNNYPPQSVEDMGESLGLFGGGGGGGKGGGKVSYPTFVTVPGPIYFNSNSFTISVWMYYIGPTAAHCEGVFGVPPEPSIGFELFAYGSSGGVCGPLWINGSYIKWPPTDLSSSFTPNVWQFVVATYNGSSGTAVVYDNGSIFSTATVTPRTFLPINSLLIDADLWTNGDIYPFNGFLTNVQFYNTSLSPSEVNALYIEGIGGAPTDLPYLMGWWPLNGNAQDYSGNGNDGVPTNVIWYTPYPPPPP